MGIITITTITIPQCPFMDYYSYLFIYLSIDDLFFNHVLDKNCMDCHTVIVSLSSSSGIGIQISFYLYQ